MKASQLGRALSICILAERPSLTLSEPGGGKSSIIKQVCKAFNLHMIDKRLSQTDAVDFLGIPYVENDRTKFAVPDWLPTTPGSAIFFDELPQAPVMVMNGASELILDGTLGGGDHYTLPPGTPIMAAGNRRSDRAATNEIPSHMKNRFVHLSLDFDVDEWVGWAMDPQGLPALDTTKLKKSDNIHEAVMAFARFRPNVIQKFDSAALAYPTARSWSFVSDLLPYLLKADDLMYELVAGCVGDGPAIEFTAFLKLITQMPDPDLIFRQPETAPIPKEPGIMYALVTALANRVTPKTADPLFTYLARIPQDFSVICAKDAVKRDAKILMTKKGMEWAAKNAKFLI